LKGFALSEFLLRGDVSSMKKKLISADLMFTDGESTRIWQVYEQWSSEMSKVNGISIMMDVQIPSVIPLAQS
jgi:hypothetical protein